MKLLRLAILPLLAAAGLSGCEQKIEAPYDKGVCWHVVPLTGGKVKFNKLTENRPNLESCAASLEGIGVAAIQDHHGARLGETGGQCIANAATGPSDEGDPALDVESRLCGHWVH